jgi:hypothetical protein
VCMATIQEFAEQHKLRLRKDGCGDVIVAGKAVKGLPKRREYANHVYDGFDHGLGVCLMVSSARKWGAARRALEAVGCTLRQHGDTEGCFAFDPANELQVAAVIKAAGLKARRMASPAQLAALDAARTLKKAA